MWRSEPTAKMTICISVSTTDYATLPMEAFLLLLCGSGSGFGWCNAIRVHLQSAYDTDSQKKKKTRLAFVVKGRPERKKNKTE